VRAVVLSAVIALALAGCGDGNGGGSSGPLSAADQRALEDAREKFLNYCGERKANGADESQPVPEPIEEAVDRTIEILEDHRDESFSFDGATVTVEAFVREQQETLENCSDQQEGRLLDALD
jgi:hypothetical protein